MISWGETGADVSVACTEPATFDLANVAIDQTVAVATMTATAAKMIILRISCHPFQRDELATALAHRPQLQGEGLHTGRFFAMAHTYRARRRHWGCVGNVLGSARNGGRGVHRPKISGARPYASSKQAAAEENPRGTYRTKLGHSIFFYRRGPESIFNGTQRYSFIECLSFFIQLLPALLHSAYDEYPVIDD